MSLPIPSFFSLFPLFLPTTTLSLFLSPTPLSLSLSLSLAHALTLFFILFSVYLISLFPLFLSPVYFPSNSSFHFLSPFLPFFHRSLTLLLLIVLLFHFSIYPFFIFATFFLFLFKHCLFFFFLFSMFPYTIDLDEKTNAVVRLCKQWARSFFLSTNFGCIPGPHLIKKRPKSKLGTRLEINW